MRMVCIDLCGNNFRMCVFRRIIFFHRFLDINDIHLGLEVSSLLCVFLEVRNIFFHIDEFYSFLMFYIFLNIYLIFFLLRCLENLKYLRDNLMNNIMFLEFYFRNCRNFLLLRYKLEWKFLNYRLVYYRKFQIILIIILN